MVKSRWFVCIVLGAMVLPAGVGAAPPASNPSEQELLDEVRALRAEVKDLRSRLDQPPTTRPAAQSQTAATEPSSGEVDQQVLHDADRHTPLFDVTGITSA
ncbi:MAG TPA: hypothetical protein VN541_21900, partial [Tepidisphaeraceae bacterium]|nr:hypothetical protein [Tepidisphaeraceae bacterium]